MKEHMQTAWIVFEKEIIDNLRDRRSLVSGIASALFTPALLIFIIIAIGQTLVRDQIENPLELPTAGAENAPTLVNFLRAHNVNIKPAPADPQAAVRNGDVKLVLVIPASYAAAFSRGEPATLQLVVDTSRQSSSGDINRANRLIDSYNSYFSTLRLVARGVNPAILTPLSVEQVDVATPDTQSLLFLNMLPYFLVLILFSGGQHIILDATAGEKERGSLEPLLISPAPRWVLMTAKMAASLPYTTLLVMIELVGFAIAFNLVPLEEYIGMQLTINVASLFWIFLVCLPMIFLAASVQMLIATFARGQKEAQTYTSLLPIALALPGIGLAFLPVKPSLWATLIPTFGQQIIMTQLLRSEQVNVLYALLSGGVTLGVAILFSLLAAYLFSGERMIFGSR